MCIIFVLLIGCNPKYRDIIVDEQYNQDIENWRKNRLESLKAPQGWLSLIALHWLSNGENSFGSAKENNIIFPASFPDTTGVITLGDEGLFFENFATSDLTVDQEEFLRGKIYSDAAPKASMLNYKSYFFYPIKRANKIGLRLRDTSHQARYELTSIPAFEINKSWLKRGKSKKPKEGATLPITNAIGITEDTPIAAYLYFDHQGETYRLTAIDGGSQYFLIIADASTSDDTYGGGRFLYVDKEDAEGNVYLDFNKAYNPPCVFTDYATCPLPPKENILPFRVEAGEKSVSH